jgi:GNAT superfamily N-acetyltransferase
MTAFPVIPEHDTAPDNIGFLGQRLTEYNEDAVGYGDQARVAAFARDEDGDIVGGVFGSTYWDWLEISLLWVREDLRGQGIGSRLLKAAEAAGVERGCHHAMLDTFSFQSPTFYRKHGYEVFGEIDGFAGAHTRYYLQKRLT